MVHFQKLHMYLYLRTKFHVSTIILTSFRQDVILPPISKQTSEEPTQIRVKEFPNKSVLKQVFLVELKESWNNY